MLCTYLTLCLFNLYAECIRWNDGLDEAQAGIKIAGRNISNLIYADDTTLMAERALKSFVMKVKKESEKFGLKCNTQKTKIMASSQITSWHIDGETMETVRIFSFLGSKITADYDCMHETKRCLLLGRKDMTNLDSILKRREINLLPKVFLVKAMVFPGISHVWMWELDYKETWVPKNRCIWTVVLEDSSESLGLQGDPTSQS